MKTSRAIVLGATILAVGLAAADGATYAATGQGLILGQGNKASSTTTLTRIGPGPALGLVTRKSSPPFTVSSKARVPRLNADSVDGMDGKSLQTRAYTYALPALTGGTGTDFFTLPGLPRGVYQVSFSVLGSMSNAGAALHCYLSDKATDFHVLAYGSVHGSYSTSNGSGIVNTKTDGPFKFTCFPETGTFDLDGNQHHASVTFVHLDQVVRHASVVSARGGAHRTGATS
jgi:hypothetical protein